MQQIERYGVIALLFLLVTIVVVALWDGGSPAEAGEGEVVAQVEQPRADQTRRATTQARNTTPTRGTRTQAQNRAQAQAERRTNLSRQADRKAASQRSRLLNPNGVPANPQAQTARRGNRGNVDPNRQATPRNQPARRNLVAQTPKPSAPAPFKAEPRRSQETSQWGRGNVPSANMARVPANPEPAVRTMRLQAQTQAKPQVQPRRKAQASKGPLYVVKSGDTLERIARRTLSAAHRWPEIQKLNGLKNSTLQIGMKLRLPTGADAARTSLAVAKQKARGISQAASSSAGTSRSTSVGTYVVKSGDVLSRIAQNELGGSSLWHEIVKLNPGLTPKNLRVGAKLKMPARRKGAAPSKRSNGSSNGRSVAKADARYTVH